MGLATGAELSKTGYTRTRVNIPPTFRLAYAGAIGLPLLVIGAIAVRSPVFADDGGAPRAAGADSGAPSGDGSSRSSDGRHGPHTGDRPVSVLPSGTPPIEIRPTVVGSTSDIRAAIEDFEKKVRFNQLAQALPALVHLIEIDPDAAKDAHSTIVDLAQRIMGLKGDEPDQMYEILVTKMGTDGLDILYEMVTTKGGSDAAAYSKKLLDRSEILARGSAAMQVAYKLRNAKSCSEVKALFPDARENGDGRTLGQLYLLGNRCGRRHVGACCLQGDKDLDATLKALQARGFR
jgi:serine/threonine-protein kinase